MLWGKMLVDLKNCQRILKLIPVVLRMSSTTAPRRRGAKVKKVKRKGLGDAVPVDATGKGERMRGREY